MSFASDLRATVDKLRAIPSELGLREHTVTLRVYTWSGSRVGLGTRATTDTPILIDGAHNPRVQQVSQRDAIASGGKYTAQDVRVGPFTPAFAGGGVAHASINPAVSASPTEVYYLVTGTNLPSEGALFTRVGEDTDSEFSYYLVLRQSGKTP